MEPCPYIRECGQLRHPGLKEMTKSFTTTCSASQSTKPEAFISTGGIMFAAFKMSAKGQLHRMSCFNYWRVPKLGENFNIQNVQVTRTFVNECIVDDDSSKELGEMQLLYCISWKLIMCRVCRI